MELKEQMGTALKSINDDIRYLKREREKTIKSNGNPIGLSRRIEEREAQEKFYSQAKSEPVRFENGVVINAKTLKAYLKKLPTHAQVSFNLDADRLLIQWRMLDGAGGSLHLKDLSKRYESFNLPAGEGLIQ